jgi:hypothetical protein
MQVAPTTMLASDPRRPRKLIPDLLMARGAPQLFRNRPWTPIADFAARRWLG